MAEKGDRTGAVILGTFWGFKEPAKYVARGTGK